jgi:hypothetical protein
MSMIKHLLLSAASVALLAACAGNPGAAPAAQAAPVADGQMVKNANGEDMECDTEMETGSHVHRHTICMTQADRDAQERDLAALRSHGTGTGGH